MMGLLVVGLGLPAATGLTKPPSNGSRTESAVQDAPAEFERHRRFVIERALAAAGDDPKSQQLVTAFEMAVMGGRIPFIVVRAKEGEVLMPTPFEYREGGFVYVANMPWQDRELGVVVLHHLVHWNDQVTHATRPMEDASGRAFGYERNAVEEEIAAVGRLTNGRFREAAREVIANDQYSATPPGKFFRLPTPQGIERMAYAWGQELKMSQEEVLWRARLVMLAVLLPQCNNDQQVAQALYAVDAALTPH